MQKRRQRWGGGRARKINLTMSSYQLSTGCTRVIVYLLLRAYVNELNKSGRVEDSYKVYDC